MNIISALPNSLKALNKDNTNIPLFFSLLKKLVKIKYTYINQIAKYTEYNAYSTLLGSRTNTNPHDTPLYRTCGTKYIQ